MKLFKRIVVGLAALSLLSSCSILKNVATSALSLGSNTGSAIVGIYNVLKNGKIDLSDITTLINIGKILTGAQSLTGATPTYMDEFSEGLIEGSSKLVNETNIGAVLNGLKALNRVDTSTLNAAATKALAGTASQVSTSSAGVNDTIAAITNLIGSLK
jgi:hypothetical protein